MFFELSKDKSLLYVLSKVELDDETSFNIESILILLRKKMRILVNLKEMFNMAAVGHKGEQMQVKGEEIFQKPNNED